MRLIAIGLAAAALAAFSPALASAADKKPPADDPKAHTQGMAEVPPLLQQTGVTCTRTDAKYIGEGKTTDAAGKPGPTEKLYEVACQEGLGYMIMAPQGGAPSAFDCFAMTANKPKAGEKDAGKPYCKLPVNADPMTGIAGIAAKAGVACPVTQARYVGSSTDGKLDEYEVACADGTAYILQNPRQGSTQKLAAADCLEMQSGSCQYLPKDTFIAKLIALAAPANRSCQATDARWIGTLATDKSNYFELACSDPAAGYVLQLDASNRYKSSVDCTRANTIGVGCNLTSAAAAQTADIATYSRLAKEVGYPCAVTSYHSFGIEQKSGREVVELACSDHPDGAIALIPVDKGQAGGYFNCARAAAVGQKCALTTDAATYAKITSELSAKGKSCSVSNSRWVGATTSGTEFVEVACSGAKGLMIEYNQGSEAMKDVVSCAEAQGIGDGCRLK